ncbi:hypothetical protein Tco_0546882 [Tanacetum coccineum]
MLRADLTAELADSATVSRWFSGSGIPETVFDSGFPSDSSVMFFMFDDVLVGIEFGRLGDTAPGKPQFSRNVGPIDIYRHILAHDEKIAAQDVKIKQLDDELQANRDSRQEARTSTRRKKTLVNFKTRRASNGSGSPRHMTLAESMPEICSTEHFARNRVRLSSTPFEPR